MWQKLRYWMNTSLTLPRQTGSRADLIQLSSAWGGFPHIQCEPPQKPSCWGCSVRFVAWSPENLGVQFSPGSSEGHWQGTLLGTLLIWEDENEIKRHHRIYSEFPEKGKVWIELLSGFIPLFTWFLTFSFLFLVRKTRQGYFMTFATQCMVFFSLIIQVKYLH